MEIIHWLNTNVASYVDWTQIVLIIGLPFFVLSLGIEWLVVRYQSGSWQAAQPGQRFYWKEVLTNAVLGQAYYVAHFVLHLTLLGTGAAWFWEHRFFTVPVNGWTLPLMFLAEELCYYVYHRSAHRIRWFWSQHVSHHTSESMNMSTAARQSILVGVVGLWIFFLPPVLLGVHPAIIAAMLGLNLGYQWFVHTETIGKLPAPLEWLLNTPSNHRVHHGRNAQYIDRNYGGVLMIYDHLFGTYVPETEKPVYGITLQIRSSNWLVLNLHEFVDMWRDVFASGPLRQRLRHLWMPPEWERKGHTPVHTWTVERQGQDETTKPQDVRAGEPLREESIQVRYKSSTIS